MNASQAAAAREKQSVAISSVAAAVVLTGTKLGIGLWTNSLGILSEAAHSGLDLVAAAVTCWAVHASAKPADDTHTYGHGKIENISALFETLLLVVTCAWILWESVERLFFVDKEVAVNVWSFAVIFLSIGIDWSRSRALKRVADKYDSQALEADALHFSTDIWSSCVVLLGLFGVLIAHRTGASWLVKADAVAALGVALIVLKVCWALGKKSVDDLLDTAPAGMQEKVLAAARVPGVLEVRKARVRKAGAEVFADVTLAVPQGTLFEAAHATADRAEAAVRAVLPNADVVVHVEPDGVVPGELTAAARILAARRGLGAHAVRVYEEEGKRSVELHLEVAEDLSVSEAHAEADAFEEDLRSSFPALENVVTHLEPAGEAAATKKAETVGEARVQDELLEFCKRQHVPANLHDLKVRLSGGELSVSMHCALDAATGIRDAHDFTEQLEKHLRERVSGLGRVLIHVEPKH
ncbi:MAG: cation-efflux pump [Elusimicrobiota bacterium]